MMKVGHMCHQIEVISEMVTNGMLNARKGEVWNLFFSTFFLTSFADKVRVKDLYEVPKNLGDIHEFIIPSKRDKRGNKYGVIRFFNVRDERMMEARDNFFIEGRKLFSNLPSFRGRNLGRRFGKLKERVKRWRKNLVITWLNPGNQGCNR